MVLKLYFDLMSQPSRALLLFIRTTKIPCEEIPVALRTGEHKTPEFRKVSPFQKVPVIDHDGFKLTESVAIFQYLCSTFQTIVPDHWYPKNLHAKARVDEFMAWQHLGLRAHAAGLFRIKILEPMITGQPLNEAKVQNFESKLENVLNELEGIWLKDKPYVAGNQISVADLLAVTELEQPGMAGFDVCQGHSGIKQYMNLVKEQLQPDYDTVHSVVYMAKEKLNSKVRPKAKL